MKYYLMIRTQVENYKESPSENYFFNYYCYFGYIVEKYFFSKDGMPTELYFCKKKDQLKRTVLEEM